MYSIVSIYLNKYTKSVRITKKSKGTKGVDAVPNCDETRFEQYRLYLVGF